MNRAEHSAAAALLRRLADQNQLGAQAAGEHGDSARAAAYAKDRDLLHLAADYHLAQADAKALQAAELPACDCQRHTGTCHDCRPGDDAIAT
jgi:hypothetical protein